ncbi:hypothetical protein EB796_006924 [Bugula neritina]|uniref:Uncharacterized protein n=1 Tax=Bugula neritina TaxID=10212 RepID=A0A7J7K805_BUGNE|nr:hypothetical protein EB796_006924 [Bugula neritina]
MMCCRIFFCFFLLFIGTVYVLIYQRLRNILRRMILKLLLSNTYVLISIISELTDDHFDWFVFKLDNILIG